MTSNPQNTRFYKIVNEVVNSKVYDVVGQYKHVVTIKGDNDVIMTFVGKSNDDYRTNNMTVEFILSGSSLHTELVKLFNSTHTTTFNEYTNRVDTIPICIIYDPEMDIETAINMVQITPTHS